MSLLSNEQVVDLCKELAQTKGTNAWCITEWSKKQKLASCFEPDWSAAPEGVVKAIVKLCWVFGDSNWSLSGPILATYERPKPVITPHPHAEIIAKYAEVAARRADPWVEFEFKGIGDWTRLNENFRFCTDFEYRYIGEQQ